ncbi:MAG: hypothetical protein KDI03_20685, partial [Anaerolineae bacterium]|nr:hypothetical protein [Anaerolineae bacterium]
NGTAQVTFNLTAPGEDALISYGVYHPEGRSLLLDTMRLYVVGSPEGERPLAVYPDRDQYQPGDTVHLTAVSPVGGVLTLNVFGTPTTLLLEPGVPQSVDVILASDLLADTYQVDFVFDTGDGRVVDSAVSFEVDGDRAAIRRVVLDAAGSACAGQVGAQLKIESRYPMDGVTLTWQVTGPDGQPAGSSDNLLVDLPAGVSWWTLPPVAFASGQAGTHAVAFSLVQGTRELASGTQSFDVGDAVVLGVAVNEAYFRAGNTASADVSIQNNSTSPLTLRVLVDGQVVEERTVSQTGYVVETVDLGALDPAEHTVTAVLQGPANCVSQSTGLATVVAPPSMVIVAPSPDGNAGWYVTAPSIFLRYNDSVPAPVDGLYAWNGEANRQDNGRALSVPADGQQELAAWAVAQDGSTSTTATQTFRVDRVPPTVTANVTGSGSVEVTLAASDETSGVGSISYRLDGGDWQVYNGPLTIQVVDPITLEYMAQDVAGNESEISTLVLELVSCEIYPIALHVDTLDGVEPGTLLEDIYNGTGPGNFGWMSWNGSSSANALVASLTPPGNSDIYTNPDDPADHDLTPGDWVYGLAGVNNSWPIRSALDSLIGYPIVVPVWDSSSGQGSNLRYRLAGFARAELTGYDLPSG